MSESAYVHIQHNMVARSSTVGLTGVLGLILSVYCVDIVTKPGDVKTMSILTSVHAPWNGCVATVPSPELLPNQTWTKAQHVNVGGCDKGPIAFSVTDNKDLYHPCNMVTFYSENLAAMPPQCSICWNGSYLTPTTMFANQSLLPGCETSDSVEGYHMTYYWFHILSWTKH